MNLVPLGTIKAKVVRAVLINILINYLIKITYIEKYIVSGVLSYFNIL